MRLSLCGIASSFNPQWLDQDVNCANIIKQVWLIGEMLMKASYEKWPSVANQ
jgi:hypothetical protein